MENEKIGKFYFIGHYLCLDFMNTLIADGGQPVDLMATFADFVTWATAAGIVSTAQAEMLAPEWENQLEAVNILPQVQAFRTAIQAMVAGIVRDQTVSATAVAAINGWLHQQSGYTEVVAGDGHFFKRYHTTIQTPAQLLVPIAQSAGDLLCYGHLALVKKCENPACVLHFYDTSKNHSRRWCSMNACGNRAKAAAHYLRKKARGAAT